MNYNEWFSLSRERKEQHLKRFFLMYHSKMTLLEKVLMHRQTNTLKKHWECLWQFKKSSLFLLRSFKLRRWFQEKLLKKCLRTQNVCFMSGTVLQQLPQMTTEFEQLKNINSVYPVIVAPNEKNRNMLECKWKSCTWFKLCPHTVAIACDTGISFDFFSEIKRK